MWGPCARWCVDGWCGIDDFADRSPTPGNCVAKSERDAVGGTQIANRREPASSVLRAFHAVSKARSATLSVIPESHTRPGAIGSQMDVAVDQTGRTKRSDRSIRRAPAGTAMKPSSTPGSARSQ